MTPLNPFIPMFDHPLIQEHEYKVGDETDKGIIMGLSSNYEDKSLKWAIVFDRRLILLSNLIYLPSTDALAEMWGEAKKYKQTWRFIFHFNRFSMNLNNDIENYPLQIIALHFLMSDLHNLKWVEGKWGEG